MKQRVMIAYDGSENSKSAVSLGGRICEAFDAKPVIAYRGGAVIAEMKQGYFKNTNNKSPARGLRMLAEQVRPMAVVVGSPTSVRSSQAKPGSGGRNYLISNEFPVAVAPPGVGVEDRGPLASLCVAVDGQAASYRALDEASAMASFLGATLKIVSVLDAAPTTRRGIASPRHQDRVRAALKILEDAASRVTGGVKVELEGLVGEPASVLSEYSKGFDLMLVGSECQGRFSRPRRRSISANLLDHGQCPVLLTPRKTPDRSMVFA